MPDGKTHSAITALATGTLTVAMWRLGFSPEEIRLTAEGCMTGIILSPDLDVDGGFLGHTLVKRYLGEVAGRIWRAIWLPYAVIYPHRSNGSHFPVISTAIRLGYLYGVYFCACVDFGWRAWIPDVHTAFYLFLGLVVSDTLHFIADIISTFLKRRLHGLHFPMSEMRTRRRSRA